MSDTDYYSGPHTLAANLKLLWLMVRWASWCHVALLNGVRCSEKEPGGIRGPRQTWVAVYVEGVHVPPVRQATERFTSSYSPKRLGAELIAQLIDLHQRSQSCARKERERPHDISCMLGWGVGG